MGNPLSWSSIRVPAPIIHYVGGLANADGDCSAPMIAKVDLCLLQEQASPAGRGHAQGPPSSASYAPFRWAATICWGIKARVWRSVKGWREGTGRSCCPQRKEDSPSVPPVSPLLLTRMLIQEETGYLALLLRDGSCACYGSSGKNGYMLLIHKVLYWI